MQVQQLKMKSSYNYQSPRLKKNDKQNMSDCKVEKNYDKENRRGGRND